MNKKYILCIYILFFAFHINAKSKKRNINVINNGSFDLLVNTISVPAHTTTHDIPTHKKNYVMVSINTSECDCTPKRVGIYKIDTTITLSAFYNKNTESCDLDVLRSDGTPIRINIYTHK